MRKTSANDGANTGLTAIIELEKSAMLTRELLKFKNRNGFKPNFIDPADPERIAVAETLLNIYHSAVESHMSRGELDELAAVPIQGAPDRIFAAGLNKLLLDRCSFDPPREIAYPELRRRLFSRAGQLLASAGNDPATTYLDKLSADPENAEFMAGDIYGDLPDNERLQTWRPLQTRELLNRYNLALVQGLLIYAESLELDVSDPEVAELRRLFKYLKFFRLLAEVVRMPARQSGNSDKYDGLHLSISGPFALFGPTRKYALQLAAFFPAAVRLKRWKLSAVIKMGQRTGGLKLDQDSAPLVSHYQNFSSYVPEEIRMFHRLFRDTVDSWRIVGDSPFLNGDGRELIFPDLSFQQRDTGKIVHLELFHRWHRTQLERRLSYLDSHRELPLVLGIDRALADDAAFDAIRGKYPALAGRIYRFRDFPGVDRTRKILDSCAEEMSDAAADSPR